MDTWTPAVKSEVRVLSHQPSVSHRVSTPPLVRVQKVKRYTPKGTLVLDDGTKYTKSFGWQLVKTAKERRANPYSVEVVRADTTYMRQEIMSAMRARGRHFSSVGDITMFNGFYYYEVCDLLEDLRKEGLAECSFAREAECDWRLTDKGMKRIEMPGNDLHESPEVAAERERLHAACWAAYEHTGAINTPEWVEASRALDAFRDIHGSEYNPD